MGNCIEGCFMCCMGCCYTRYGKPSAETADAPRQLDPLGHANDASTAHTPSKIRTRKSRIKLSGVHDALQHALQQQPTDSQNMAISRLQTRFAIEKPNLGPDMLIEAVIDLDMALFSGALSDRTTIIWVDMPACKHLILRGTCSPDAAVCVGTSTATIRLNREMFKLDTKEVIWGTVVHEMLHAHLALSASTGSQLGGHHGEDFKKSCEALSARLALDGLTWRDIV